MKHISKFLGILLFVVMWGGASAQYCMPSYTYGCTSGDGVILFQLGTINQSVPCSGSPSWYHDYTGLSTNLMMGVPSTVTVQAGYSSTYCYIYIDYDHNNTFDAGELAGQVVCGSSYTNYTVNITPPLTALSGPTRLRILTNWLSYPTGPCGSYSYGNCCDFTVNIAAPYCTPTYSYGCGMGDGLVLFQLNTINQAVSCTGSPSYYHDWTASVTGLVCGNSYTMTVQAGYSSTYVSVWIDLNNNNTFETSERLVTNLVCTYSYTNYTAQITIPAGTPAGNHRLRFRTNWAGSITDPCASYTYGNAGDFTVNNIIPPCPTMITQPATGIGSNTATLNGSVNPNGGTTTVSYEYGLTTAYGTSVPASIPVVLGAGGLTPDPVNIAGLAPGTLYHYRINGLNGCGTTANGLDMTFTTTALPPTAVTNPVTNLSITGATLMGTVTANGAPTSVSFDWGLTTAYGNNIVATPATVNGNTPTAVIADLTGLTIATTYHYRVVATNAGGTTPGLDQSFYTCVNPSPAGAITGPANVCIANCNYVYTIDLIPNAVTYVWSVPPGGVITGGQGTSIITVCFPLGSQSGQVSVYGTSVCGSGTPSSMTVTVNPLPVPTVSGPASSCIGYSNVTYSTEAGNFEYDWMISGGGQITGGLGTNSISVTWNSGGAQSVSVNYKNPQGCVAPNPTVYNVTVNASPTPTITGQNTMCVNSGYYYYNTEPGNSNYQWTISPGGTITYGQGTDQIQVTWNTAGAQWVTANYSNASGCYAPSPTSYSVTVSDVPGAAGPITGSTEFCVPSTGVAYSVNPILNAESYVWTLPAGATITSGEGTNSIMVDYADNASSGVITVYGNSLCGNGTTSPPLGVTAKPTPVDPNITIDANYILTSDATDGNQWYMDGSPIAGATGQTHDAKTTGDGNYHTVVTMNGCSSGESNHLDVVIVIGIGDSQIESTVKVYPNPTDGKFILEITSKNETTFNINVVNNMGVNMLSLDNFQVKGTVQRTMDFSSFSDGVYNLVLTNGKNSITKKIVLNK